MLTASLGADLALALDPAALAVAAGIPPDPWQSHAPALARPARPGEL